jgi:hypothetical protein
VQDCVCVYLRWNLPSVLLCHQPVSIGCVEIVSAHQQSDCMCVVVCVGFDHKNAQLSTTIQHHIQEKAIQGTKHSALNDSLQTIKTQYESLQATHTQVTNEMVQVNEKYTVSMEIVLKLQQQLKKDQVYCPRILDKCLFWKMLAPPHYWRAGAG